jgi:hypothetical protein
MSAGQRYGCLEGGTRKKPKTRCPSREAAQAQLDWMVENLMAVRALLRVYECRYSDPGVPHFHVGRKPKEAHTQYGRIPATGRNHRR